MVDKRILDVYASAPSAGNDPSGDYLLPSDDGANNPLTLDMDQIAAAVATRIGTVVPPTGDPSLFVMTIQDDSLIANIGAVSGVTYTYWIIQKDNETTPTGSGTQGIVPATYAVDTSWTADTLQPHAYTLFTSTDDSTYTQVVPTVTVTAVSTSAVDQTPNDVNFPDTTNVATSTAIYSNTVSISGLLAPTAITIADGEYSKNGNPTYTSSAGVIENSDTIQLKQTSSGSASTETTTTVQLGLLPKTWGVTTAAAGVTHGVISIISASYSGAEDSTIAINLARTGGDGIVGVRCSTLYVDGYHTAENEVNYLGKIAEIVEWADSDTANKTVTITNIDTDMLLDIVGELVIDSGSEYGGATVNSSLNSTLFKITGTGAASSYIQEATGDHIIKVTYATALAADQATNTPGGGLTWTAVAGNGGSYQSQPVSHLLVGTPGYTSNAAELYFYVDFSETGDHYFWLDCMAASTAQNTCWLTVDDVEGNSADMHSANTSGAYAWSNDNGADLIVNIATAGVHKISLWNREESFNVTTLLATDNGSYDAAVSGDAEEQSNFDSASGGDDPNNPTVALGPPLIIDDKTPDPFPFGELIEQATSATNIESNAITIAGINVPTEISITSDPSGTAEYKIDAGSWVTAAGTISLGSTITCRLDASASNATTVTMDLKIGTVTQSFAVTTVASGEISLEDVTSTIVVSSNGTTVEDKDIAIAAGNGDGIHINNGVTGTVIQNCRITSVDGHAIVGNNIGSLDVHECEISNCWGSGVYIYGIDSATIHDNTIENVHSGIELWNGKQGNLSVEDNWIKNLFSRATGTASIYGSGIQMPFCIGANILIDGNIIINDPAASDVADKINLYQSSGTALSPITITNNKLNGKAEFHTDSTVIVGDSGGNYTLVENNIFVNAGSTGGGISEGHDHTWRGNQIFCEPLYKLSDPSIGISNVGISPGYTAWAKNQDSPTPAPYNIVYEDNDVTFWKAANFNDKGGQEFLQPYYFPDTSYFGPDDIGGWSTNRFDTDSSTPAGLTSAIWLAAWSDRPSRIT